MGSTVEGPTLLNTAEAARYLGFKSAQTLRNLRNRGHGPAFLKHSPRIFRYEQTELDRYLTSVRATPTSAQHQRRRAGR